MMKKLNLPYSSIYPPLKQTKSRWAGLLTDRELQALGFEMVTKPGVEIVDVSQNVGRGIVSCNRSVPTLTPTAKMWLVNGGVEASGAVESHPRPLVGKEMLELQGFPTALISEEAGHMCVGDMGVADNLYADLAGNMFTGPLVLAFLIAIMCTIRLPAEDDEDESADETSSIANASSLLADL